MDSDELSSSDSGSSASASPKASVSQPPPRSDLHLLSTPATSSKMPDSEPGQVAHSETGKKRKASDNGEKKHRKRKRSNETDTALNALAAQVSGIQQFLAQNFVPNIPDDYESEVSLDVSGELYKNTEVPSTVPQDFSLSINTVLKEPTMPKSNTNDLELLKSIQHFDSDSWCEVRYSDVQKKYCSTPGFTELECNDELKPYEKFNNLALVERGFAAITQGLLKQHETAENGFKTFLAWLRSSEVVDMASVEIKIKEIFSQGEYQKVTNDLLQLTCGHRADLVQQRRDAILRSVKDKFVKSTLRKIPPTCENLFKADVFSSALEKHGGINKTFWPVKPCTSVKPPPVAQTNSFQKSNKLPAQGMPNFMAPSGSRMPPAHGVPYYSMIPAQGIFPYVNQPFMPRFPSQGQAFRPRAPRGHEDISKRNSKPGPFNKGQAKRKY